MTPDDAARLILANGRAWVHNGAGPNEVEFLRAGRSVRADRRYGEEVVRDALTHAADLNDHALAASIREAADLLGLRHDLPRPLASG